MTIRFLYHSKDDPGPWAQAFRDADPELEMMVYPEMGDPAEIVAAFVWRAPHGLLASLPNLKLIHSKGAGVDHIFDDPKVPAGVPIARLVDPMAVAMMGHYAIYHALGYHRRMDVYRAQQAESVWRGLPPPDHERTTVAVLGLGAIGREVAGQFQRLGFRTLGWSRSAKTIDGVDCRHGADALFATLAESKIVVNVLALTRETENILNAQAFAHMPRGGFLINIARGPHIVEADLIQALDSGQLGGATLDVFRAEPLAKGHPFWTHPKVTVTPHMSGDPLPRTAALQVARNIRAALAGQPLLNEVDRRRGY